MALTKEDLQAIAELMDSKLEPMQERLDKLEPIQEQLDKLEATVDKRFTDVDNAIADVKNLINVAAADAAKTEKTLREHMEQPHIA